MLADDEFGVDAKPDMMADDDLDSNGSSGSCRSCSLMSRERMQSDNAAPWRGLYGDDCNELGDRSELFLDGVLHSSLVVDDGVLAQ
jgi:hypothetical protein